MSNHPLVAPRNDSSVTSLHHSPLSPPPSAFSNADAMRSARRHFKSAVVTLGNHTISPRSASVSSTSVLDHGSHFRMKRKKRPFHTDEGGTFSGSSMCLPPRSKRRRKDRQRHMSDARPSVPAEDDEEVFHDNVQRPSSEPPPNQYQDLDQDAAASPFQYSPLPAHSPRYPCVNEKEGQVSLAEDPPVNDRPKSPPDSILRAGFNRIATGCFARGRPEDGNIIAVSSIPSPPSNGLLSCMVRFANLRVPPA